MITKIARGYSDDFVYTLEISECFESGDMIYESLRAGAI